MVLAFAVLKRVTKGRAQIFMTNGICFLLRPFLLTLRYLRYIMLSSTA